ncbi:MAG: LysM peptidoglycan-binding domain-containing protein, partial [Pseudoclavibacter sp.]|nr:LysM peptidoglycan-binding domain-containing protein [Pseudoclavibacter sp.]
MPRILSGLGAALGLALLVFGVPIALLAIAGPPLPQELAGLPGRLLRPDPGGRVLMGVVVPLVAWIAWGYFACSLLLELADRLRGRRAVRLGIMRPGRACASLLVGAVAGALALGPASAQALPAQLLGSPGSEGRGAAPPVEVREGDTLWGIAERHLGDGERYPEIALASGIEDPDRIEVGQPIVLPGTDGSEAIGGPDGPDGTGGTNDTGGTGGAAAPDGPGRP